MIRRKEIYYEDYEDLECPADLFGAPCSGNCSICPYCNKPDDEEDSKY